MSRFDHGLDGNRISGQPCPRARARRCTRQCTLAGLFLSPVFTTGLVWLTRTLPGSGATTLVFARAFLGPVVLSPVVGTFKDFYGSAAIPTLLLGITVLCLAVAPALGRSVRSASQR